MAKSAMGWLAVVAALGVVPALLAEPSGAPISSFREQPYSEEQAAVTLVAAATKSTSKNTPTPAPSKPQSATKQPAAVKPPASTPQPAPTKPPVAAQAPTKGTVQAPAKLPPAATTAPKPLAVPTQPAPAKAAAPANATTYLLRYKFNRGETLRWDVEHQAEVRMTVSGTTQTAETYSKSVKLWKVTQVDKQGRATFIHSIDNVQMRQKLTGRQEVTYDSTVDKEAPVGFQDVAKSVGKPLSSITIDALGKVLNREDQAALQTPGSKNVTIPLPEEPAAIGFQWSTPDDLQVTGRDGQPRTISRRQQFTLESVSNGVATIRVETQVLTPVNDPAIEAQLVQGETSGKIRFDLQAGRILSQQMDLDKHVVGVQGDASSMHYLTRFTERLDSSAGTTAAKSKIAGPAPPQ